MPLERLEEVKTVFMEVFSSEEALSTWGPFDAEVDLAVFDNPHVRWWIALDDATGHVVGFISGCIADAQYISLTFDIPIEYMRKHGKIGYKAELGVLNGFGGRGIAGKLTRAFLKPCAEAQIDQFRVHTKEGTGNYGWYEAKLLRQGKTADGRVVFGCDGVPEL